MAASSSGSAGQTSLIGSCGLTVDELAALLEETAAVDGHRIAAPASLAVSNDVPMAIQSYAYDSNSASLASTISSLKRYERGGRTISHDIIETLQNYTELSRGEDGQLDGAAMHVEYDEGTAKILWFAVQTPQGKALIQRYPHLTTVQVGDFTFGLDSDSKLQLGVKMGILPEAGGKPIVLAVFVYLGGAGIEKEKTAAQQWFEAFCRERDLGGSIEVSAIGR